MGTADYVKQCTKSYPLSTPCDLLLVYQTLLQNLELCSITFVHICFSFFPPLK